MPNAVLTARKAHHIFPDKALHPEPAHIIPAHRVQQLRQVAQAVFPVFVFGGGLHQRLFDMGRRGKIRRTHAQIVQRAPLGLQRHLAVVQRGENFRAEQLQTL